MINTPFKCKYLCNLNYNLIQIQMDNHTVQLIPNSSNQYPSSAVMTTVVEQQQSQIHPSTSQSSIILQALRSPISNHNDVIESKRNDISQNEQYIQLESPLKVQNPKQLTLMSYPKTENNNTEVPPGE